MDFVNESHVEAGWTMGFERSGRELLVVAVKATFVMPQDGAPPELAPVQAPLTEADTFTGEPGLSATVYECDYAHHRPKCDVLLNGSAYAPPGRMVQRLDVGLRVGAMTKVFAVVGHRVWRSGLRGPRPSEADHFTAMPISYDNAFGGIDRHPRDSSKVMTFVDNPVGRGYCHYFDGLDNRSLPNTEEVDRPVVDPRAAYRPMAFGAIGRSWPARARHAGTYNEEWLEQRAPFWPDDFDYRYFQAAPADQQVPHLRGGERVVLSNLTPSGRAEFVIPSMMMPVWFVPQTGKYKRVDATIDTLVLEPDLERFSLTWRVTVPMRRSCFDMRQVIAGETSDAWQRAQKYGDKPYYRGLGELVRARRGRAPRG
jgi:hypothetical protein